MTHKKVFFRKGSFHIMERGHALKKVSGTVTNTGIGIHKATDRKGYTLTQIHSGQAIGDAATMTEAKEKAARLSGVKNWNRTVTPNFKLSQKVRAINNNEPLPSTRKKDEYDLQAFARRGGHIVDHEHAYGYEGQKKERKKIRSFLHEKHIGYKLEVNNITRHRRIK